MEKIKNYVEFLKNFAGFKIETEEFENGKALLVRVYEGAYSYNFYAKQGTEEITLQKITNHCQKIMMAE